LTGPAYVWLVFTVLLPLSAMFYFSLLTLAPIGGRLSEPTLDHYLDFFPKGFYFKLTGPSLWLWVWVAVVCLLLGFPAAYALAKHVKGRWREALFLMTALPFWSDALVRTFSWTMVLRSDGLVDRGLEWLIPGLPHLDLLFTFTAVVIGLV